MQIPVKTKPDDLRTIERPRVPDELDQITSLPETIEDDAAYEGCELTGLRLAEQRAERLAIAASHAHSLSMNGSILPRLELVDVIMEGCDLANASLERASLDRVELIGCRLMGSAISEATLRDLLLRDCGAAFSRFRQSNLKRVRFERCDLRNADFSGSDLRGVVFDDCDLTSADFGFTHMLETDFTTSIITDLRIGLESLRGAIVNPTQAAELARLAGLLVRW